MVFRGMLVVAIRADRLGDLAEHEGFAQIIQSHLLMLTTLSPDGLRTVIEKPAEQAGLILEPGLVEILVRDADGRSLPLLSRHASGVVPSRGPRSDRRRIGHPVRSMVPSRRPPKRSTRPSPRTARGCCATSCSVSSNHPRTVR